MKRSDFSGKRFGRLVVLSYLESRSVGVSGKRSYWLCQCDCGKITEVGGNNLQSNQVKSCGCLRVDVSKTAKRRLDHGHASTSYCSPTYRSWRAMLGRCQSHLHYIQRGIAVCDRWKDFRYFLSDMGVRPDGHTIDRYPNRNGGYEPTNCRWATPKQQAKNRGAI